MFYNNVVPVSYQSVRSETHRALPIARVALSALIAVVVGLCVFAGWQSSSIRPDFWQPWFGASSLLAGVDPYPIVGPGREYAHEYLYLYPLTSSAVLLPLGLLSWQAAVSVFSGVSAGLLAYFAGYERWPVFLSFPFISAAWAGQWGALFAVAFMVPALSFLYAAKPTIGLAMLAARFDRDSLMFAAFGGMLLLAFTVLIVPHWPMEWLENVRKGTGHMSIPVLKPGGFVALFALLRWKRPEARLIAFFACVPQTGAWYELVPLFLVCLSFRQSLLLALLTTLPIIYEIMFASPNGVVEVWPKDFQLVLFAYLPCVVMVLLRKNEPRATGRP